MAGRKHSVYWQVGKLSSYPVVSALPEKEGATEGIGNSRVGQRRRV